MKSGALARAKGSRMLSGRAGHLELQGVVSAENGRRRVRPSGAVARSASSGRWARRALILQLHRERSELLAAHVLERVGRERCTPDRSTHNRLGFQRPRVGEDVPVGITADEIARSEDVEDSPPSGGCARAPWNQPEHVRRELSRGHPRRGPCGTPAPPSWRRDPRARARRRTDCRSSRRRFSSD
jgi:hypothetical protein